MNFNYFLKEKINATIRFEEMQKFYQQAINKERELQVLVYLKFQFKFWLLDEIWKAFGPEAGGNGRFKRFSLIL